MEKTLMRATAFHDFSTVIDRLIELGIREGHLRRIFESELTDALEKHLTMCPHCGAIQEPNDEQ